METLAHLRMEKSSLYLSVLLEQDGRESLLPSRIPKAGLPPSFLFLQRMTLDQRSRAVPQPFGLLALREGAARAATAGRPCEASPRGQQLVTGRARSLGLVAQLVRARA